MKPVVLITGASSGLGMELSITLAKQGYNVYATMRNLEKQKDLLDHMDGNSDNITVKQLDVLDTESIDLCVSQILEKEKNIDILVNNAGAGFVRSTEQATDEEIRWQIDLNLMGVIRCTKAVLPSMREARRGHVVNISSVGGLVGQPFNEIYCAAKFGVEGYTEALASYIQPSFGINFTVVEPGGIVSEFANSALKQLEETGGLRDDDYKPILEKYLSGARNRASDGVYQTGAEVAEVVAKCIAMEKPPIRMRTSDWGEAFCGLKTQEDPDGRKQQSMIVEKFLR